MASPLISTQFSHMQHWSFVYLVHIGLLLITVTMQAITFTFQSQEGACQLVLTLPVLTVSSSVCARDRAAPACAGTRLAFGALQAGVPSACRSFDGPLRFYIRRYRGVYRKYVLMSALVAPKLSC